MLNRREYERINQRKKYRFFKIKVLNSKDCKPLRLDQPHNSMIMSTVITDSIIPRCRTLCELTSNITNDRIITELS